MTSGLLLQLPVSSYLKILNIKEDEDTVVSLIYNYLRQSKATKQQIRSQDIITRNYEGLDS